MRLRSVIMGIVFVATTTMATAQRSLPTREALDTLINPPLSRIAEGALAIEPTVRRLGDIADDTPVNVLFTVTNTTPERIDITELRTSCSCLKILTPVESLAAGDSCRLRAEFNPQGRSGEFMMRILLYTSLDATRPTARLDIEGRVITSDPWSHLPESMGVLRLSRKSVTLDGIGRGTTRRERIAIANSGDRELRLTAQSTTTGLRLHTEPEVVMPGAEGDIVISYTPEHSVEEEIATMLIVEGCEARPSDRIIRITIRR